MTTPLPRDDTAAPDALMQLHALTQVHHQNLEDALGLGRSPIDRESYVALLRRFHALYRALESDRGLGAWSHHLDAMGLAWQTRRKLSRLQRDLVALGATPIDHVAALEKHTRLGSISAVLGRLYVLEGSTLGGRYISRSVHELLGLTPETGLAFFEGYAHKTGLMWRILRGVLAHHLQDPADVSCAVEEAQHTFLLFHEWLTA